MSFPQSLNGNLKTRPPIKTFGGDKKGIYEMGSRKISVEDEDVSQYIKFKSHFWDKGS